MTVTLYRKGPSYSVEFPLLITINLILRFTSCSEDYDDSLPPDSEIQYPGPHPLSPLTSQEIQQAVQLLESAKQPKTTTYLYLYIGLDEPEKSVFLPYFLQGIDPLPYTFSRKAFLVLYNVQEKVGYESIVNLNSGGIERLKKVPDDAVLPLVRQDPVRDIHGIVKGDEKVRQKCADYGYPNMTLVYFSDLNIRFLERNPLFDESRRLVSTYPYGQNSEFDNSAAHPIPFMAVVDLESKKVIDIQDVPIHNDVVAHNEGVLVPKAESNYNYTLRGGESFLRKDDKPITSSSPEGPSFMIVNDWQISWQKWAFVLGYNAREGPILHMVSYNDNGKSRAVMYRGSIAEMYVTYGDPRPPLQRFTLFDMGAYGMGYTAQVQKLNQDALGSVKFFDFVVHDTLGNPVVIRNAVSLSEQDAGILWKHRDRRTGKTVTVRSRKLVVSFMTTAGHYDYLQSWEFYQDGSIRHETRLTGVVTTATMEDIVPLPRYGTEVFPRVNALNHHHVFTARLDLDVASEINSVHTVDTVASYYPSGTAENPSGTSMLLDEVLLDTQAKGRTNLNTPAGRFWKISNPSMIHGITKQPVGWKLVPGNTNPHLMMKPNSPLRPEAGYLEYDVWVTRYRDRDLYPAGLYVNVAGLPEWVGISPDANITGTDIVVWYNFGAMHIVRAEDFPIMPAETVGFWLKPYNFFQQNPALDVPPAESGGERRIHK